MDLAAILNAEAAAQAHRGYPYPNSCSTVSDGSSRDAATPGTPMDCSPSPVGRRGRHSFEARTSPESRKPGYRHGYGPGSGYEGRASLEIGRLGHGNEHGVMAEPEQWKSYAQLTPHSNMVFTPLRPRSHTHAYTGRADDPRSPTASDNGSVAWSYASFERPASHHGLEPPPQGYPGVEDPVTDRSRLPSVHELFSDQLPPHYAPPFPEHPPAYDTDATLSDSHSASASPPPPAPPAVLPSRPASGPAWSTFDCHPAAADALGSPPSTHPRPPGPFKPRCAFVDDCTLAAPPRRIVSHYFGRNKKETRAIPDGVWVFYCRQHYQRAKYRQRTHVYAQTQMRLVRQTVANLERWGGVLDFAVNLRKRAVASLRQQDEGGHGRSAGGCETDERWLLPFTGPHQSFAQVYEVIDRVAARSRTRQCPAAEFELVPNIRPELMGRRASRGEKAEEGAPGAGCTE